MAGRSDFNAMLPRVNKRTLLMGLGRGYISHANEPAIRKLFIEAHTICKKAVKKASKLMNRDSGSEE